jgi:hypothetical protein
MQQYSAVIRTGALIQPYKEQKPTGVINLRCREITPAETVMKVFNAEAPATEAAMQVFNAETPATGAIMHR